MIPWYDLQQALETWGVLGYIVLVAVVTIVTALVLSFFGVLA